MTIHKINPDRVNAESRPFSVGVSFQHELYDLAEAVFKTRAIQAFDSVATRYPIHRLVRCAARRKLEDVFDDLALNMELAPQRLDTGSLLLDGPGAFIHAEGRRKVDYCSCTFNVWADSKTRAENIRADILRIVGDQRVREEMFVIDWNFTNARGGLASASFEEIAREEMHDEAYPTLGEPVVEFVRRYLSANETVLILQGAPGTGKTRLVRAVLGEMSRRKGDSAEVMYTADKRALETDEIFIDFITGAHDAFVVEDADHMLMARTKGNQDLHRFLAIADGVVRAQGRKIIFTTNLPNIGDLDEALLRRGRCFATVRTRPLVPEEAERLIARICGNDSALRAAATTRAVKPGVRSVTVAELYRACAAALETV